LIHTIRPDATQIARPQ